MASDDVFKILAEVFVKGHRRVSQLRFAEDFCNGSSAAVFSSEHSDRPVILLNHDLNALLHFGERGMKIASHVGFAHVDSSHGFHYGAFSSSTPTEYRERLDGRVATDLRTAWSLLDNRFERVTAASWAHRQREAAFGMAPKLRDREAALSSLIRGRLAGGKPRAD
jgi:hypothetical protein